mmetsp:Transcript_41594/g.98653  ORF Transcript_41594/g.98653 Transcript_41594/m.98653 type:complete len:509 (+) Transcript_41594:1854-3380(+)
MVHGRRVVLGLVAQLHREVVGGAANDVLVGAELPDARGLVELRHRVLVRGAVEPLPGRRRFPEALDRDRGHAAGEERDVGAQRDGERVERAGVGVALLDALRDELQRADEHRERVLRVGGHDARGVVLLPAAERRGAHVGLVVAPPRQLRRRVEEEAVVAIVDRGHLPREGGGHDLVLDEHGRGRQVLPRGVRGRRVAQRRLELGVSAHPAVHQGRVVQHEREEEEGPRRRGRVLVGHVVVNERPQAQPQRFVVVAPLAGPRQGPVDRRDAVEEVGDVDGAVGRDGFVEALDHDLGVAAREEGLPAEGAVGAREAVPRVHERDRDGVCITREGRRLPDARGEGERGDREDLLREVALRDLAVGADGRAHRGLHARARLRGVAEREGEVAHGVLRHVAERHEEHLAALLVPRDVRREARRLARRDGQREGRVLAVQARGVVGAVGDLDAHGAGGVGLRADHAVDGDDSVARHGHADGERDGELVVRARLGGRLRHVRDLEDRRDNGQRL